MARYDKYEPLSGGFRAHLASALTLTGGSIGPVGVSLNASGLAVVGTGGQSGLVGVLVKNASRGPVTQFQTDPSAGIPNAYAPIGAQAGDVVDIMTSGEIVDLDITAFPAGTTMYTHADGSINATATAGTKIGYTVEAGRLVVRVAP